MSGRCRGGGFCGAAGVAAFGAALDCTGWRAGGGRAAPQKLGEASRDFVVFQVWGFNASLKIARLVVNHQPFIFREAVSIKTSRARIAVKIIKSVAEINNFRCGAEL